jgi:hypothetical protein
LDTELREYFHAYDHVNVPKDKYEPPLGSQSSVPGQLAKSIGDKGIRGFRVCPPLQIPLTFDTPDPVLEKDSDSLLIDVYSAGLNFFDVCTLSPFSAPTTNRFQILQTQGRYQTQAPRPFWAIHHDSRH